MLAQVKSLKYEGYCPPRTSAEVAYIIVGNKVIFTATESSLGKTITVNAAKEIIRLICEAEGLDWQLCVFYDLQTQVGYPHFPRGYFSFEELLFANGELLEVEKWKTRSTSRRAEFMTEEIEVLLSWLQNKQ